jgi:hypothetical protein
MNLQNFSMAMTVLQRVASADEILVENRPYSRPGYVRVLWRRQDRWMRCSVHMADHTVASLAVVVRNMEHFLYEHEGEYSSFLTGDDNGTNTPRSN